MNLARLNFTALRLVVLCAEEGSLTHAASRANMSVSGASHKLTTFEEELGRKIFVRTSRGLKPTEVGSDIIGKCRQIVQMAHELAQMHGGVFTGQRIDSVDARA